MTLNTDHCVQYGIPMEELVNFNPGDEFKPYVTRKKPQLIPKKMHIIWIDGEEKMTAPKKRVMEMNKALNPDYEYHVWSLKNITREKFPKSYQLLKTLYEIDKTSFFSKKASMADVLRH